MTVTERWALLRFGHPGIPPLPDGTLDSLDQANLTGQVLASVDTSDPGFYPGLIHEIYSPTDLETPKVVLNPAEGSRIWQPKFRHPAKGIGVGSFNLQRDDAALADIEEGDLVRVVVDTRPVFEWFIQTMKRHTVAKAAGAGVASGEKYVEIAGPSTKGYGARSPIQPWRGGRAVPKEIIRPFDWTTPHFEASGYDLSDWESATELARVDSLTSQHWKGSPAAYPDNLIQWIAGSDGTDDDAVEGVRLIRFPPFELTEDKLIGFFGWCDNEGIGYLQGVPILYFDSFEECRYIDLQLVAGSYFFSVLLRNATPTATSSTNNPTGCGIGVYERTAQGLFVDRIFHSNNTAEVLALPDITPGMPYGYAVRKLLDEGHDRGELVGVTPGFSNTEATNGETFPANDVGAVVTQSFSDYLLALEDAALDVEMAPGLDLRLYYPKGSNAVTSSASFVDGVSLKTLDHEERDDRIDKLFVDYEGGYLEVGTGQFSKSIKLQQVNTEDAVTRISDEILDGRDVPSVAFTGEIVTGQGREPYVDFKPGDTVTITDVDDTETERPVQAILLTGVDRSGRPIWNIEVGDLLEPLETIADRAVKRFAATRSATNIHSGELVIRGSGGQIYKQEKIPFTYEVSDLQISQKRPVPVTRNIGFLEIQLDEADIQDHTFTVKVNGSTVAGLTTTIAAGDDYARTWEDFPGTVVTAGVDKITLEFDGDPLRFDASLVLR